MSQANTGTWFSAVSLIRDIAQPFSVFCGLGIFEAERPVFGDGPWFGCVRGSVWQLQVMRFVGTPSDVAQVLVTCIRDPWPGVCWGLVAWGRSGTCGLGSVGDMWPGVSQGHVAGGLSGTCGTGSAGGPRPGVGRGPVARDRPAARGRGRSGTRGPTGRISSAPSCSASCFLLLLSLRRILSLPSAEGLSLSLVCFGLCGPAGPRFIQAGAPHW